MFHLARNIQPERTSTQYLPHLIPEQGRPPITAAVSSGLPASWSELKPYHTEPPGTSRGVMKRDFWSQEASAGAWAWWTTLKNTAHEWLLGRGVWTLLRWHPGKCTPLNLCKIVNADVSENYKVHCGATMLSIYRIWTHCWYSKD